MATKTVLAELEAVPRDYPRCCNCRFYWEDPNAGPRLWGFCRYWPPTFRDTVVGGEFGVPSVDYKWHCSRWEQGIHPDVQERRNAWRAEHKPE